MNLNIPLFMSLVIIDIDLAMQSIEQASREVQGEERKYLDNALSSLADVKVNLEKITKKTKHARP